MLRHGYNGDRAIGFVGGIAACASMIAGIVQFSPFPFLVSLAFVAIVIFAPRQPTRDEP